MKRLTLALALLALVALPAATAAQLAPEPYDQEYLKYIPPSSAPAGSYTTPTNGVPYYVGPYVGQFLASTSTPRTVTSAQFSIYCVDMEHYAKSQLVNSTSIGTGAVDAQMGDTRLGANLDAVSTYRSAAYLASLFDSWQSVYSSSKNTAYSIIHSAIWKVVQNKNVGDATLLGWRNTLLTNHADAMDSYSADGWYVLTATNKTATDSGQEFLIRTNVVPEPSTYLLLATGLIFLVAFGRKRLASRGGSDLV